MRSALIIAVVGCALPVRAAPRDDARQHFYAGVALAQKHDFRGALVELEASYRLEPLPEVLFDIALAERALGRFADAFDHLQRCLSETGAPERRREVEAVLRELEPRIATLTLVTVPAAELRVDGKPASAATPLHLDPGVHQVEASAPGYATARRDIALAAGRSASLRIALTPLPASAEPSSPRSSPATPAPEPAPTPPPTPVPAPPTMAPSAAVAQPPVATAPPTPFRQSAQARAALGVGVGALALLATGAVTGGVVLADKSSYQASCARLCDDALYDRAHALAVTTDVLIGVGAAAAVTSVLLLVVRPRHRVAASVAANRLFLRGEF